MLYRTDLKDWYDLPCVFCTLEEAEAYAEEMEADAWAYETLTLSPELEADVLRIAKDMNGEEMEALDGIVSAVVNGGEELSGLIEWLAENGYEDLVQEFAGGLKCYQQN